MFSCTSSIRLWTLNLIMLIKYIGFSIMKRVVEFTTLNISKWSYKGIPCFIYFLMAHIFLNSAIQSDIHITYYIHTYIYTYIHTYICIVDQQCNIFHTCLLISVNTTHWIRNSRILLPWFSVVWQYWLFRFYPPWKLVWISSWYK